MQYRREIDGLRALAVLPVILFHAGFTSWFGGGFVGVDVFFVISGYLVTSIILSEKEAGRFSVIRFYERRARRILPALFFVVAVTSIGAWLWLLPADLAQFWRSLLALSAFSSNILFWRESGYFDSAAELKPLLHTWSLAVEEQYYLLFPLFVMALWRLGRRGLVALLLVVALLSLALSEWATFHKPMAAYFLLPTRAWELLIGSLIAFHFFRKPAPPPHFVSEAGSLLGLALLAAAVVMFDKSTPFPGLPALLPTLGSGLIILFATPRTLVGRLLGTRLLVGIGLVSYSAYLWHQPLFALARHRSLEALPAAAMLALCVVSLALAAASWRYVEQPFRKAGTFTRPQIFKFSAAATGFLFLLGLLGSLGLLAPRYGDAEMAIAGDKARREQYTWARMEALQLKEFASGSRKVLVVGDSQAADFVNILHESHPAQHVSFSTYTIPWSCPNLYLPYSVIDSVRPADRAKCQGLGGYRDPVLAQRLKQADEVWLVSAWQPWNLDHLGTSLRNLRAEYGDKFTVVGQKSFRYGLSQPVLRNLARMSPEARKQVSVGSDDTIRQVNHRLNIEFGAVFLDLPALYCADGVRCRLFDDAGEVIPYDDTHVTPAGARFVGRQLVRHPRLQHLFDQPPAAQAIPVRCNGC